MQRLADNLIDQTEFALTPLIKINICVDNSNTLAMNIARREFRQKRKK